jgi:hypothetical protein
MSDRLTDERVAAALSNLGLSWPELCDLLAADEQRQALTELQERRAAERDRWKPSGADYDRSIHSNNDQYAWADFFLATFPNCGADRDLMAGWFANAMMAKHDSMLVAERAGDPERERRIDFAIDRYRRSLLAMAGAGKVTDVTATMVNEQNEAVENLRRIMRSAPQPQQPAGDAEVAEVEAWREQTDVCVLAFEAAFSKRLRDAGRARANARAALEAQHKLAVALLRRRARVEVPDGVIHYAKEIVRNVKTPCDALYLAQSVLSLAGQGGNDG